MEAMGTIGKIMPLITGGTGVLSNIIRGNRVNQAQKAALSQQQQLQQLINNPALLAQKVQAMTQPLNQGLVQGVENQAQGGLAERGLGTSPQIANEVFAQALGPYQQQNQSEALRAVLQTMGMDQTAIDTIIGAEGQPTDTSGLWGAMQKAPGQVVPFNAPASNRIPSTGGGDLTPPDPNGPGIGTGMPDPSTFPSSGGGFPGTDDIWGDMSI